MTTSRKSERELPGLTACGLCAGETLGQGDPLPGGQRARLDRLDAAGVARVTYVDCLDECERGDVVVARPATSQRHQGASPTWFERLAGEAPTAELQAWLRAGGPGAHPLPQALQGFLIERAAGSPDEPSDAGPHLMDHHNENGDIVTASPTSVIDPVCGMSVEPESAAASAEHEGTTYYFCAKGCQKAFLADPGQYV